MALKKINFKKLYKIDSKKVKKKRKWHWLVIFVLFCIGLGIFTFHFIQPQIKTSIANTIAKKGIKSENTDVSMSGHVHLKNVHIPFGKNGKIFIGTFSFRPPFSLFTGTLDLRDIKIYTENLTAFLPDLHIDQITLKDVLQFNKVNTEKLLQHIEFGHLKTSLIEISLKKSPDKITLTNLTIKNYTPEKTKDFNIQDLRLIHNTSDIIKNSFIEQEKKENSEKIEPYDLSFTINFLNIKSINNMLLYKMFLKDPYLNEDPYNFFDDLNFQALKADYKEGHKQKDVRIDAFQLRNLRLHLSQEKTKLFQQKMQFLQGKDLSIFQKIQKTLSYSFPLISNLSSNIGTIDIKSNFGLSRFNALQMQLSNANKLLPENFNLSVDGGFIDFLENEQQFYPLLKQAGYFPLQFSGNLDVSYDKQNKILDFNSCRLSIKDAFTSEIKAKILNVHENNLSNNSLTWQNFAKNIAFKEGKFYYANEGIIEHLRDVLYQIYGIEPNEIVEFAKGLTEGNNFAFLNDPEKEEAINKTLQAFLTKDSSFLLTLKAKDPEGIQESDLMDAFSGSLKSLLEKMDITFMRPD